MPKSPYEPRKLRYVVLTEDGRNPPSHPPGWYFRQEKRRDRILAAVEVWAEAYDAETNNNDRYLWVRKASAFQAACKQLRAAVEDRTDG